MIKLQEVLKSVGGGAAKAAKLVGGIGLAAAGAATAIALLVKQSFDFIDTIGKTSARTGIATDTLQAFQLAAIESGTSVEQTQKGLKNLLDRLVMQEEVLKHKQIYLKI